MTDEIMGLKTLVAAWERKAKQAEDMLVHLRAALAIQEGESAPLSAPSKHEMPEPVATPPPKLRSPRPSQPFSTKYERTAAEYILELKGIEDGLSLRQIQDSLAADGKEYSDQAVNHTLKKLEETGVIRKRTAPEGVNARHLFQKIVSREVQGRLL